jgi:hypothetical protein
MWSHLGVCKKISFVIDRKQKTLVLEPKPIIEGGDNREENLVTVKVVGYKKLMFVDCYQTLHG